LPAEFNQLTYFGAGPHETYPDRKMALVARYSSQVRDQYVPYIKPQESGGHSETRWFQVKGHGQEITLSFDRPIQFSCLPFSQNELAAKSHDVELTSDGRAHINFDLAHRGVGTASCGPDTLPEYLLTGGKYELTWRLQLKTLTQ
jgi:beta-galactosidase